MLWTVSSGVAQRRSMMPERCWIHSSLESMASTISEFGTTRLARWCPRPRTALWRSTGLWPRWPVVVSVMRRCPRAGESRGSAGSLRHRLRVQPHERLTRRHQVAVLDEPLHDGAAVRGEDRGLVARGPDRADRAGRRQGVTLAPGCAGEGALGR